MKNTIIKYGLISGGIIASLQLVITLILRSIGYEKVGFENAAYVGYTMIILSMAVIFFGIKAYRDTVNDGKVSIGKGFLIGLGIALISCVFYSLMWMFVYYNFMPNFFDDYASYSINKLKSAGASVEELAKNQAQIDQIKEMYKSPLGIFAITLTEPLPVGIVISLIASLILKRK